MPTRSKAALKIKGGLYGKEVLSKCRSNGWFWSRREWRQKAFRLKNKTLSWQAKGKDLTLSHCCLT